MKIVLIFIFSALTVFKISGQKRVNIDSLIIQVNTLKSDTVNIELNNTIASEYNKQNQFQKSMDFAKAALELSIKLNYESGKAQALKLIGYDNINLGNNTEAVKNYIEALQYYIKINDEKSIAGCYNNLGYIHNKLGNYDEASKYHAKCLEMRKRLDDKPGIASSYNSLGNISYDIGKYDEALSYYKLSLSMREKLIDKKGIMSSTVNIGNIYIAEGNYKDAISVYEKGLEFAIQLNDLKQQGIIYNCFSNTYFWIGNYTLSLDYIYKSLKITENIKDQEGIMQCYNFIATIYSKQKNYTEALRVYNQALKIANEMSMKRHIANIQENMSNVYFELLQTDEAIKLLNSSLAIRIEIGDKRGEASTYNNIGAIKMLNNNLKEAESNHQMGLKLFEEIGSKTGIATSRVKLGEVLFKEGRFLESIKITNSGIKVATEINDVVNLQDGYFILSKNDSAMGNFKESYENYKKYLSYKETLFNKDRDKKITELHLQYEFDKKQDSILAEENKKETSLKFEKQLSDEKVIQQQKDILLKERELLLKNKELSLKQQSLLLAENQRKLDLLAIEQGRIEKDKKEKQLQLAENKKALQASLINNLNKDKALQAAFVSNLKKNRNMIFAILLIMILFGGTIIYFRNRTNKLTFQKKLTETELNVFRSQMNPHFMFNALNSIHSFILSNETDQAAIYLEKFSTLMRMILENSTNPLVSLADDLKALDLYLQLESERLDNNFKYEISIEKDLDTHSIMVPPLMFQPFVENSVWHGMTNRESDGKIRLSINKTGELLQCIITDNGTGLNKKDNRKGKKSYGVAITRQRIENLNKVHKAKAYYNMEEILDANNLPMGVKVELGLPMVMCE